MFIIHMNGAFLSFFNFTMLNLTDLKLFFKLCCIYATLNKPFDLAIYSDKPLNIMKFFKFWPIFCLISLMLISCGKIDWDKETIADGTKRARQNVEEGRGFKLVQAKTLAEHSVLHLLMNFGEHHLKL